LGFMVAQGGVSVVLGAGEALDELPVGRVRTIAWDDPAVGAMLAGAPVTAPPVVVHPDQLAYVMFTSGSQGRPKGVQVTHRGVVNLCLAQQRTLGVSAGDGVLQFASWGFDASVWELVMALAVGGRLVIADAGVREQPTRLGGLVGSQSVMVATLPPS